MTTPRFHTCPAIIRRITYAIAKVRACSSISGTAAVITPRQTMPTSITPSCTRSAAMSPYTVMHDHAIQKATKSSSHIQKPP